MQTVYLADLTGLFMDVMIFGLSITYACDLLKNSLDPEWFLA